MSANPSEVLSTIRDAQSNHTLSILKLAEPIASLQPTSTRASDVSTISSDTPTPSSLSADLIHYKELFSKLRFSYVEQVTKEKFIRSIVSDPPTIVAHAENVTLEAELALVKSELKKQKDEVATMVEELERIGRELVGKWERVKEETVLLETLPTQLEELEATIKELRDKERPHDNPLMNLSLEKTVEMVKEKEKEKEELERELRALENALPKKTKELERAEAEVQTIEVKRTSITASAKEAKKRKLAMLGGAGDDLEERGRWWRGVDIGLRGMLGVEN